VTGAVDVPETNKQIREQLGKALSSLIATFPELESGPFAFLIEELKLTFIVLAQVILDARVLEARKERKEKRWSGSVHTPLLRTVNIASVALE